MSLLNNTSIGARDIRITIQVPVIDDGDANSDIIDHWDDVCTIWADAKEKPGHEDYEADRLATGKTITFNIRRRKDIDEKMRIVYLGYAYRIISIVILNRMEMDVAATLVDNEVVT